MTAKVLLSKVLEINNCNKDDLVKAILTPKFWEKISPVTEIEACFNAPNVLHTKSMDKVKVVNIPIEMEGELVFDDKGEEAGKGRLIENMGMNVKTNYTNNVGRVMNNEKNGFSMYLQNS